MGSSRQSYGRYLRGFGPEPGALCLSRSGWLRFTAIGVVRIGPAARMSLHKITRDPGHIQQSIISIPRVAHMTRHVLVRMGVRGRLMIASLEWRGRFLRIHGIESSRRRRLKLQMRSSQRSASLVSQGNIDGISLNPLIYGRSRSEDASRSVPPSSGDARRNERI